MNSTQLGATSSVPGTYIYSPFLGTILGEGPQTLNVLFIPTDYTDYNIAATSVSINVLKHNTKTISTITWSNPADIVCGTLLGNTQLDASVSVPETFVYTPSSGTVLNANTDTLRVSFIAIDTVNYAQKKTMFRWNFIGRRYTDPDCYFDTN